MKPSEPGDLDKAKDAADDARTILISVNPNSDEMRWAHLAALTSIAHSLTIIAERMSE